MLTIAKRLSLPFSLKSRFALAIGLLIAFTALILTSVSVVSVQRGIETVVMERQDALTAQIARDIDQHFQLRQNMLLRLAADLAAHPPRNAETLRHRVELYHSLGELFASMAVVDRHGRYLVNMSGDAHAGALRYTSRAYFTDTLRSGAPVLTEPSISEYSRRPQLMMTAPVRDASGAITHVLVGTIDLARDSVLRQPGGSRAGHLYIASPQGRFVSHPQPHRIGSSVNEDEAALPGFLTALRTAVAGTRRGVAGGQDVLLSFQRMQGTGWLVALAYPTDDAFAFADTLKLNAATMAAVLLLVLAPAAWMLLDRGLRPIARLRQRLQAGVTHWRAETAYPPHEIGELARAFDQLMGERTAAERAMADSEQMLRKLADNIPAMVAYVDCEQRFVFGNQRYQAFFGVQSEHMPGMSVRDVVGPTVYESAEPYIAAALGGQAVRFERCVQVNGQQRWDRVAYNPHIDADGKVRGYFALVHDITLTKTAQLAIEASERRIRAITDNMPALIGYIDLEQRFRFCNRGLLTLAGIDRDRILGRLLQEVFGAPAYAEMAPHVMAALQGTRSTFERCENGADGPRYLHHQTVPDLGADGRCAGCYLLITDITEQKTAQLNLMSQHRLLRNVTDNLPSVVSYLDRAGKVRFANRRHEAWVEVPVAQLYGQPVARFLSPEERREHESMFQRALAGETVRFAFRREMEGQTGYFEVNYLPQRQPDGEVEGVTIVLNDVSQAKQVEEHLRTLARFDPLTGLPNRMQLSERIAQALTHSARTGRRMALLYLDLDKFKSINDSFGHAGGDAVLKEFGRRLLGCVRKSDTVGRLAGDEFVILLEHLNADRECAVVAHKIVKAMEKPFVIDAVEHIVTTSIGIALPSAGEETLEGLLKRADTALYQAKGRGRNQYAMLARM